MSDHGVLVSTSWTTAPHVAAALGTALGDRRHTVLPRESDWGYRGVRLRLRRALGTMRLVAEALRSEGVVVVHGGSDVFALAIARRLVRRPRQLVAVDFLIPALRRFLALQRRALRGVDEWVCIRRGDIETLTSTFGVDRARCHFAHFPPTFDPDAPVGLPPVPVPDGYVFASGFAHRDWPTLFDALFRVDAPAVVSLVRDLAPVDPHLLPDRIVVLDHTSPAEGQALAARATVVVVPMYDTDLPAGPSVLVDAMALGRPVIASDTRGSRDYVVDGVTGWLVPPGDVDALAAKISEVLADDLRRESAGEQARQAATTQFTPERFATMIAELVTRRS